MNYNEYIVGKPKIENKTKQLYDIIKKQFDAYLTFEQFKDRDDLFIFVIRNVNNEIVGVCLVRATDMEKYKNVKEKQEDNKVIYVRKIVSEFVVYRIVFTLVDKKYRGQGKNQELLDAVYDHAKKQGDVKYINANIRVSNESSIKSFMKNGYKVSKLKTTPYKNGESKIRVVKFIK